jgi:hypothetical protein
VAKSPNELIRDLTIRVEVLAERDATRRAELEGLKARLQQEIDERKASEAKSQEERTQLRLELAEARRETDVLKQQLPDHLALYQEWDKRRWGLFVVLPGAVLTLASGLIVTPVKVSRP